MYITISYVATWSDNLIKQYVSNVNYRYHLHYLYEWEVGGWGVTRSGVSSWSEFMKVVLVF